MKIDISFLKLLGNISFTAGFIPLVISILKFRYVNKFLIPLFILFVASGLIEILNKIHINLDLNNYYIFHYYTAIEFALFSIFYGMFLRQYFNSVLIFVFIPLFLTVCYIDYRINGLTTIDNFSLSIESVILTSYSLFLFYYVLKNLLFEDLLGSPVFWINTAILIYFSGNLLLFVFSSYLILNEPSEHNMLWSIIHSFLNIFYNVLLSIGFWKAKHK